MASRNMALFWNRALGRRIVAERPRRAIICSAASLAAARGGGEAVGADHREIDDAFDPRLLDQGGGYQHSSGLIRHGRVQHEHGADRVQLGAHEVYVEHVAGHQLDAGRHGAGPGLGAQHAHGNAMSGQLRNDEGADLPRSANRQDRHVSLRPLLPATGHADWRWIKDTGLERVISLVDRG